MEDIDELSDFSDDADDLLNQDAGGPIVAASAITTTSALPSPGTTSAGGDAAGDQSTVPIDLATEVNVPPGVFAAALAAVSYELLLFWLKCTQRPWVRL